MTPRSRSTLSSRSPTNAVSPNEPMHGAPAESVALWRTLTDVAGRAGLGVVIVQDTEAGEGVIVFANDEAALMSGSSRDELLGKVAWDLLSPSFVSLARERYRRRAKGENVPRRYNVEARRKDGTTCPIEVAIGATTYMGHSAIVAYYMDVSERQRIEQALRDSEEQYAALVGNLADAVITSRGGAIVWCNDRAEELFGYSRNGLMGKDAGLFFPEGRDSRGMTQTVYRATQKGRHFRGTTSVRRGDGALIDVEFSISRVPGKEPPEFVTVARDVTEREKAQRELRESQERLKSLFEYAPDCYYLLDSQGRLVDGNRVAEEISGYKREELIGKSLLEVNLLPPEDIERAAARLAQMAHGEFPGATEYTLIRKDGRRVTLETRVFPVRVKDQALVLAIGRDITERKRAEEALRKAHDDLEARVQERTRTLAGANRELQAEIAERKEAEEALRASEEKYRLVVENANEAIVVAQEGTLKFANAKAAEITGYSKEEMVSKPFVELIHPDDRQLVVERHLRRLAGEDVPQVYPFRIVDKGGGSRWVEINAVGVSWEGRAATLNFLTDVTERRRFEEALQQSEQQFKALIENSLDGIAVLDSDLLISYVSPSAVRVNGYQPEELIGRPAIGFIHPDDAKDVVEPLMSAAKSPGQAASIEVRLKHKDGSWRVIEGVANNLLGDPTVRGVVVNFRDVTQRKQAEEALRQGAQYFRSLIENAQDAISIVGGDGSIRYESPSFERMLGYKLEDYAGQSALAHVHEDDLPRASEMLAGLWQDPGGTAHTEIRVWHRDGSPRILEVVGTNLLDDPAVRGIVANMRDITEKRKSEEERKRIEQQLQLAGRLAAVGELAAGVAHEVNNPLSAIQAFAQFLASRDDLDEAVKRDVETIYREAQRATKITGNLLSFARRDRPEKRFVSMNEVVERSLELHAYRMKVNNVEVVTELAPDLPGTMADFNQMQQVFVNIISNAEQAMTDAHGRGTLCVKTEAVGDFIRTTFTDDGPGISEENLKVVFDPFFTTKQVGSGTGLGLSICYGLVEGHGGHLYARSKLGQGSTFVVEIPISSEAGDSARAQHGA